MSSPHISTINIHGVTPENIDIEIVKFPDFATIELLVGDTKVVLFFKNETDARDFGYKLCATDTTNSWSEENK